MSMSLTIDRIFKASPERLYEVWTTERHLSQWFGVKVEADPKVGGTIRFHFGEEGGPIQGKFLNLDPYEQIAFTWTQGCDDLKLETTVYVTLKREADGTRLSLRHEGFLDQKSFDEHDEGWLVYMELWALQINSGPSDTKRASIAETFSNKIEVTKSFFKLIERPSSQLRTTDLPGGITVVQSENFEAKLTPCRFGTCIALTEWGFATEEERILARQKWLNRFTALKEASA